MNATLLSLTGAGALGAGLVGGIFFAFSVFVMRALASLPPAQGIAAMQRINVTVLHPLFLGPFLGSAPLLGVAAFLAFGGASPLAAQALTAAFVVYALGSVGVTIVCNVPRNERLKPMAADSAEAQAYWPVYVREWLRWNHVRTVASLLASALCTLAVAA